ncbi:unnamed protein product, partial [Polarella glacialis]
DNEREIPSWDGHPAGWLTYTDEFRIWLLGELLDVPYSTAARLVQKLSGPAKRMGNAVTDVELMPDPPPAQAIPTAQARAEATRVPDGEGDFEMPDRPSAASRGAAAAAMPVLPAQDTFVQTRARLTAGVTRLLVKLAAFQPKAPVQKGLTMRKFTGTAKFWRRPGERVTDFIPRWDEGVSHLSAAGVDLSILPDLLGYYFLTMLNLYQERKERLLASLPDEHFDLQVLKEKAIQFFPEMHQRESRFRQPLQPQSGASDEPDEMEPDGDEVPAPEFCDDEGDGEIDSADIQGVIRQELDALVTDIETSGTDLGDFDAGAVESAASTLASTADAFAAVREWQPSKPQSQGPRPSDEQPAIDHPIRRHPGRPPVSFRETIALQKANTFCKSCGVKGYLAGDPQCTNRVSLTDTCDIADDNRGVADTACVLFVCGARSWAIYSDALAMYALNRPGDRTDLPRASRLRVTAPVVVAGTPLLIHFCVVDSDFLPRLLGRDFFEATEAIVDIRGRALRIGDRSSHLKDALGGHLSVDLRPQAYKALRAIVHQSTDELPQRLQPRPPAARRLRDIISVASVQVAGVELSRPQSLTGPCSTCTARGIQQCCVSGRALVCKQCVVGQAWAIAAARSCRAPGAGLEDTAPPTAGDSVGAVLPGSQGSACSAGNIIDSHC